MTRRVSVFVLVLGATAVLAANALAGTRLTRTQYRALLNGANASVTRVETAAERGLTPKASLAQARALLLAWASTETRLGKSYRAVAPPRDAVRANTLLWQGELKFGSELAFAANHLPKQKAKVRAFLTSRLGNATGARKIDAALALLKKAGY